MRKFLKIKKLIKYYFYWYRKNLINLNTLLKKIRYHHSLNQTKKTHGLYQSKAKKSPILVELVKTSIREPTLIDCRLRVVGLFDGGLFMLLYWVHVIIPVYLEFVKPEGDVPFILIMFVVPFIVNCIFGI